MGFRIFYLSCTTVAAWWYGVSLSEEAKRSLLDSSCFHGEYKFNLSISSCARPFLHKLTASLPQGLCVLETNAANFSEITVDNSSNTFFLANGALILAPTKKHKHAYAPLCFAEEAITVPLSAYAASATSALSLRVSQANPIIQQAVQTVSADNLQETVTLLSTKYNTRNSLSIEAQEVSEYLSTQYETFGFNVSTFIWDVDYAPVVIAEMKGVKFPDQIVIVGGHYDSRATDLYSPTMRAPGADDNGSGTANLLEIARVISSLKVQFQYTIRLCSFAGEEQGLLGSRAYAAEQRKIGANIIAMLNGDMLGYQLPDKPVSLGMKNRYVAPWLLSVVNSITALYVPQLPISTSPSCCSDHQAFTENGYPAVGFFENPGSASDYPHYHKQTDLVQYLNFDQMKLESSAMLASAMTFAVPIWPSF